MKESSERVQYIAEYLASYKAKIESLNKLGLFDTATLFEICAQKICEIWFGQHFINVNEVRATFPYVDLLSLDKKIFVQVSTAQDIPKKIKSTLEKLRDKKTKEIAEVNHLYFFVLANESVKNVRDYSGSSKIGNIEFLKSENLITTDMILSKARTNMDFQKAIYDLLRRESECIAETEDKLCAAIKLSRTLINNNIDGLINNEYEIDRSELVCKIREEGKKFISIQGEAGSGKSAICKKILTDEKNILYARAEKISESSSLDDVWGINLEKAAQYLKGQKLIVYIDALEFIADSSKTKFDILYSLYDTASNYDDFYIITSCRTCDKNAFLKIENIYNVCEYQVDPLSDEQIIKVAQKYKIIKELWDTKAFVQLLKSPFYLNLIVKEIKETKRITDINSFRTLIWSDIICMGDKPLPSEITSYDIKLAVETIVLKRAKDFLTGVRADEIDYRIVKVLLSEGIITTCENNTIRLKYDIFEDICFERYIDGIFDDSKGVYEKFFTDIEDLGRCVYRRYQIWVENKLFSKNNREKFLFKLLEKDIPDDWRAQTIVGIVKSVFCKEFFCENERIFSDGLLWNFIEITNKFAFEARIHNLKYENALTKVKPIGLGRSCLIQLLYKKEAYKDRNRVSDIIKLCTDYSMTLSHDKDVAASTCRIMEFFAEEELKNLSKDNYHSLGKNINEYLLPLYRLAKFSNEWIKTFWNGMMDSYLNGNKIIRRVAEDIIIFVLKNTTPALAVSLPQELCEVANTYWIKIPRDDHKDFYYSSPFDHAKEYGLSSKADVYSYDFKSVYDNTFIRVLSEYNPYAALDWIIGTANHIANSIRDLSPDSIYNIEIWENDPHKVKNFMANSNFWLAGIQEHRVPELISDAIYLFTSSIVRMIYLTKDSEGTIASFAERIKTRIVNISNNIMPLSIIAEIGRNCADILPGYSVFLASSIELVMLDNQKMSILTPNPERQLYENLVLMTMGIPELKDRYDVNIDNQDTLKNLVLKMQLSSKEDKMRAETLLDYLYSAFPNEGENAYYNLQIQKMDLRKASIRQVGENAYLSISEIEGEAKKIVEDNQKSKYNLERAEFQQIVSECNELISEGRIKPDDYYHIVDRLKKLIKQSDISGQFQKTLVLIMASALEKEEISSSKRSDFCKIWMEGIEGLFNNGTFAFDVPAALVLFKQVESDISSATMKRLKRLMLNILLYRGQQGIISKLANVLKEYLATNERIAKCFFITITEIAKDEMNQYVYNAEHLKTIGESVKYEPNIGNPPVNVKDIFEKHNINLYESKRENIIDKYLYNEEKAVFSCDEIDKYDVRTICYAFNCGMGINDTDYRALIEKAFPYIIHIISISKGYDHYLDPYAIGEVETFLYNGLRDEKKSESVLKLLFNLEDYSELNNEVFDIYDEISSRLLATYFDGYNDSGVRLHCEDVLNSIESKINTLEDSSIQNRLYAMLFLTLGRFHMNDWNKLRTKYSYNDKMFLNRIWSKYGYLHLDNLLSVIYQLHIKDLLPEVLIPLNISLRKMKDNQIEFERIIKERKDIINLIITKAFLNFSDKIKEDVELTQSFEGFLTMLVSCDLEEAAVILDEFLLH